MLFCLIYLEIRVLNHTNVSFHSFISRNGKNIYYSNFGAYASSLLAKVEGVVP